MLFIEKETCKPYKKYRVFYALQNFTVNVEWNIHGTLVLYGGTWVCL